jgi:hypothetical protein
MKIEVAKAIESQLTATPTPEPVNALRGLSGPNQS